MSSLSSSSSSPVCKPARTSSPSCRAPSRMASALLIARLGPSKVASIPSPSDLTKRPRDVLGGVPRVALVDEYVVRSVQHQRRALDARERVARIQLPYHRERRGSGIRSHR